MTQQIKTLSVLAITIVLLVGATSCKWGNTTTQKQKVTIGMVTFPGQQVVRWNETTSRDRQSTGTRYRVSCNG